MHRIQGKSVLIACACALLILVTAGGVGAVSIAEQTAPADVEAGDSVQAQFVLEDLYTEYESWTLRGETELTNVTWTVEKRNAGDQTIDGNSFDGQQFNESIALDQDTVTVLVQIQGTVPAIDAPAVNPPERITIATFRMIRKEGMSTELDEIRSDVRSAEQPTQTVTSDQPESPVTQARDEEVSTPSGPEVERGLLTNSDVAFLDVNDAVTLTTLTIAGFVFSVIGMLVQLYRGIS